MSTSPEALLLIAAARGEPIVQADIDPLKLIAATEAEGMTGLLARAMGDRAPLALRTRAVLAEARAAAAMAEIDRVVGALRERGIRALVIKGPLLSQQFYGDPGLRSFSDIDLLVTPGEADSGEAVLRAVGYRAPEHIPPTQQWVHRRFHHAALFTNDERQTILDFHWTLANPRFPLELSFEELWQRRDGITPGLLDAAVYSAAHAAKHLWSRLEMLAQLAAVARCGLDWEDLDRLAVKSGAARRVGLSFLLVKEYLGMRVPPLPQCLRLAQPVFGRVRDLVQPNLFTSGERRVDAAGGDVFVLLDRRRDALRALAVSALVPTHSDWDRDRSGLAYWIRRPLRLVFGAKKRL